VTRLFLVRHGQSEWNAVGRWQGHADPPLSKLGRAQAHQAAASIAGEVDAVVSSDLGRAFDTATIMADVLDLGPVSVDPRWRERDVGQFTGLTRPEIEQRWPRILEASTPDIPGGESSGELLRRGLEAVDAAVATYGDARALVVSHGGLIRRLERHVGAPVTPLPNLGGAWLEVADQLLRAGPRLLLVDPDEVAVTVPQQL
jgi:broad specificity phosphatase PhoE